MPTYACTVMPSICKPTFSDAASWIEHELSPDHNFIIGQTVWLCANHVNTELPFAIGRHDQPLMGGCNLSFNNPQGLWSHCAGNDEIDALTEYRAGRGIQRFWCGFCQHVYIISISGDFSWDKGRFDHIRAHFEGWSGQPESQWTIGQWREYENVDDAKWKDLPPQAWSV